MLVIDACWPADCPARRQARHILTGTLVIWASIMATAALLGVAFVRGRH